jgi:hypothetical protein
VDLATGGGANMRFLAPRFGGEQHWLLADNDLVLLRHLPNGMRRWAQLNDARIEVDSNGLQLQRQDFDCRLRTTQIDLARQPLQLDFTDRDLITASALLDLVSAPWLRSLVAHCWSAGAIVLFALTYDGRIEFTPPELEDELVRELVNRHQRTDKSFGPALGPYAGETARRFLQQAGYDVRCERSDWDLGPADAALQINLIDGWVHAALAIEPHRSASLERWRERRHAHVRAGRSRIIVGHEDLLAISPGALASGAQVTIK